MIDSLPDALPAQDAGAEMPRHIAFVTHNYPSKARPHRGTFVEQLVTAVARRGVKCSVIHPLPIHHSLRDGRPPIKGVQTFPDSPPVTVLRPRYVSFSNRRFGPFSTYTLTHYSFQRAAKKAMRLFDDLPDIVYGHFFYPSGAVAAEIGRIVNRPSFVAVGESLAVGERTFWSVECAGPARFERDFRDVTGVLTVSNALKRNLVTELGIPVAKIGLFPNGVDLNRFFPRDRAAMRRKFDLPPDAFIVAFAGHLDHRKGPLRVSQAVGGLDGAGMICMGAGPMEPDGSHVLFQGVVPHETVPEMLSAADVFVLPTLSEGSCNAIIEAMACGLPVVTSVGEFNDEIVDETMSIRVDPLDVGAIRRAVSALKDDSRLRDDMSTAACQKAGCFDINRRAERICSWISERISDPSGEAGFRG